MTDYISREAFKEKYLCCGYLSEISEEEFDSFPAADVAEARHGEWLLKHIGHGHYWECSECHTNPCIYVTENTKFRPNCGAKMDLEGEYAAL